jgi:hypothetical protein
MIRKIKRYRPLNYINYSKKEALELLVRDYDYKPYPYKHYESVFTRFYQGYILPNKFTIDKRKLHLSNEICTGEITREQALETLKSIPYPSEQDLKEDTIYFLKKMKWTGEQLEKYLSQPAIPHDYYKSDLKFFQRLMKIYKRFFAR